MFSSSVCKVLLLFTLIFLILDLNLVSENHLSSIEEKNLGDSDLSDFSESA